MDGGERVFLTRERIASSALEMLIRRPDAGAITSFEGTVRAERRADGVALVALDYSAHEPMAVEQLRVLRERSIKEFAILDAAITHRLGRLALGEVSVAVSVVAGHRATAFDACRWLIDALKADVPIWKKDIWADGREDWTPTERQ